MYAIIEAVLLDTVSLRIQTSSFIQHPAMGKLDDLPPEILRQLLEETDLGARDLATLEAVSFTFRSSSNIFPNRRASLVEHSAKIHIESKQGPWKLSDKLSMELLMRCDSRWTKVLRFMEAVEEARGERQNHLHTYNKRVLQVAAGYYRTVFVNSEGHLLSHFWHMNGTAPETFPPTVCTYRFGGTRAVSVAAGKSHFVVLDYEGQVYTFGDDVDGCCGHGDAFANTRIESPRIVEGLKGIPCKQVSAGGKHTVALSDSGRVFTWGSCTNSRLGNGTENNQTSPRPINRLENEEVVQIAAGGNHTLLLTEYGSVYSFGCGYKNQLGHGPLPENEIEPRKIMSLVENEVHVVAVAAGDENSAAIDSLGQVYTWGENFCGALGHGHESLVTYPKKVERLQDLRIVQVSMKKRKSLFLTDSGEVYGSGWNGTRAFGSEVVEDKVMEPRLVLNSVSGDEVVQVSAGWYHTAAVTRKGRLQGFGEGADGLLWAENNP